MNDLVRLTLAANTGVIRSTELADVGCADSAVRSAVRRGDLIRVRAGAFVDGNLFRAGNAAERHVLTSRAVVRNLPGYAATHLTAVAIWNLPVIADDLHHIDVAQVGLGRARRTGRLRVHPPVSAADVTLVQGTPVVRPELAVLEASLDSMRAGVIAADAAVRAGLTTRERLVQEADDRRAGYSAYRVADLASGLSESPGESWTRLLLAGLGLDARQQVDIHDHDGRFIARVDFLLPELGVVLEFDGAMKYAGADGREALVKEKRREDAIRALGYRVLRLTWVDLHRPERIVAALGLVTSSIR